MPQVTVYIREEDLVRWKAVQKKSEFIHNALNGAVIGPLDSNSDIASQVSTAARIIKSTTDAEKATLNQLARDVAPNYIKQKLCKIHGTPLDDRGRCLVKGCKYS